MSTTYSTDKNYWLRLCGVVGDRRSEMGDRRVAGLLAKRRFVEVGAEGLPVRNAEILKTEKLKLGGGR